MKDLAVEPKNEIQIIIFNNKAWKEISSRLSFISDYLAGGERSMEIARLMNLGIRLIASEFVINPERYAKYQAAEYSGEDFVDMLIESMTQKVPDIEDAEGNISYIEDFRRIVWPHMKTYTERIPELINIMAGDIEGYDDITDKDIQMCVECLTVAWVESILRKRESFILEHDYGD